MTEHLHKETRWRYRRNFWIMIGLLLTIWLLVVILWRFLDVIYLPFSS